MYTLRYFPLATNKALLESLQILYTQREKEREQNMIYANFLWLLFWLNHVLYMLQDGGCDIKDGISIYGARFQQAACSYVPHD